MTFLFILVNFVIASVCALIAEKFTPALIPGGLTTALIVALIGTWVGGVFFKDFGPNIAGVYPISCFFGSAFLLLGLSLLARALRFRNV